MFFYHRIKKYLFPATISYIIIVIVINVAFSYAPFFHIFGQEVSPMDAFVGAIYLVRDFAQREIRHYVLIAMLIGLIFSYVLAKPAVAIASAVAFMSGELVDWLIFTFTRKPLSQRLLWSAALSTPIDSSVFLIVMHQLNIVGFLLMSMSKWIGVFALWYWWKRQNRLSNV
ncbi:MAG: uncharacterized protein K0S08_946 [Gammaproteobacteria bacterium]|jgi:uncharacterized PurR-regulated membrane protein YhhQ (DUF165 family)|nr:uncharacterized protein [Gammaproteobacteria bacterium]